jgi:hypothetical protein
MVQIFVHVKMGFVFGPLSDRPINSRAPPHMNDTTLFYLLIFWVEIYKRAKMCVGQKCEGVSVQT